MSGMDFDLVWMAFWVTFAACVVDLIMYLDL